MSLQPRVKRTSQRSWKYFASEGSREIQVDEMMDAALRDGLAQSDGIHLTAEGYRRVAAALLASIP